VKIRRESVKILWLCLNKYVSYANHSFLLLECYIIKSKFLKCMLYFNDFPVDCVLIDVFLLYLLNFLQSPTNCRGCVVSNE
jgi:hypothetical protein